MHRQANNHQIMNMLCQKHANKHAHFWKNSNNLDDLDAATFISLLLSCIFLNGSSNKFINKFMLSARHHLAMIEKTLRAKITIQKAKSLSSLESRMHQSRLSKQKSDKLSKLSKQQNVNTEESLSKGL